MDLDKVDDDTSCEKQHVITGDMKIRGTYTVSGIDVDDVDGKLAGISNLFSKTSSKQISYF